MQQATFLALGLMLGCGGSTSEPEPEPATPNPSTGSENTVAADTVPSPPEPWESMTTDAKQDWMIAEVMPRMATLFEEYDAERFGGANCATCHGASARDRNFAMPNPNIMALHPTGTPEQQQMVQDHPQMVRFMFQKVLPQMQTLLGAEEYNAETQEGFSCYACHPSAVE